MNWKEEYSEEFDKLRKNRVEVSYYKYGPAKDNFGSDLHLVDAIKSHNACLEKYKKTGNTEYLLDAANYIMFEYMYPQHPNAHFRATGSDESAGISGVSINEIRRKNNEDKAFDRICGQSRKDD